MQKLLKNLITVLVIAFLLAYLYKHWGLFKELLRLNFLQICGLYLSLLVISVGSALVVMSLLSAMKIKTNFLDMVLLQNASVFLNYAPMKFGTIFRAGYLKRHYQLGYWRFMTFFLYITFLMTATASVVGLVVLVFVYGLADHQGKVLALIFLGNIIVSASFMFVPLPVPSGKNKLTKAIKHFLESRNQISEEKSAVTVSAIILMGNFILTAARLWIIYHSMGKNIHPGGYLVLGAIGFVMLFISLTPGALGIREFSLGFGAVVLGVPLEIGVMAAMIDRAITLSYAFVAGGVCAGYLWKKSPDDFDSIKKKT